MEETGIKVKQRIVVQPLLGVELEGVAGNVVGSGWVCVFG